MEKKEIVKNYLSELNIDFEIKTLEDITKLIKAHVRTLAFSSLKVLLKEEISLELEDIYENLVVKKRGAYCFEHNKLMYEVLKYLGFDVTHYLARVVNNKNRMPPATHRFTLLTYKDEKYIIDVGIGFRIPSVPVKFGNNSSISHLGIEYKIVEHEDKTFSMQLIENKIECNTQNNNAFVLTKFDLSKCYEEDFELGHFYSHKYPKAVFVNNLVVSLIYDDVIYSLVNNKYLKIFKNETQEIEIKTSEELEHILKNDLKVNFTSEEIDFLFKKIENI